MSQCCNKCYESVEDKLGAAFSRYGRFVARHPWKIIVVGVLFNGLLGIGMIRLNVATDVDRVYTPIDNQAGKDADMVKEFFPDLSGSNYIGYQIPNLGRYGEVVVIPKGGNILNGEFLTKLLRLYGYLLSTDTTDARGKVVTLNDICARSFGNCAIDGDLFVDTEFITAVNTSLPIPFPYFIHSTRGQIYYEQLIGESVSSAGILKSATKLQLRVNLRTDSEYFTETAKKWQKSFLVMIKEFSSDDFDIVYSHTDSLSEELDKNIAGDIMIFSVTFTIMITYACIATMTARCDVVGQKANLGFAGVLAAGLAIVAAFGLGSICGVEFVSIVGVLPFLIIGIGVDDMFMLMSGIANTDFSKDVETRIGETMRTSGVSITITSLTDLLAFAAGASSIFLSVRNFCIYSGIAVIICYVNQATIFLACIAINEYRTEQNRHFGSCLTVRKPGHIEDEEKGKCFLLCCTGRKPNSQRESEGIIDRLPRWLLPKIIRPVPAKIAILTIFVLYLGVAIWGVIHLEEGLELQHLVEDSSYYFKYREYLDKDFPQATPVSFVFQNKMNYSDSLTQAKIDNFVAMVKAENTVKDYIEISWLTEYRKDSTNYDNSSELNFVNGLRVFLSLLSNTRFQNDVVFDKTSTTIKASRIHFMSESIKQSQEQGQFMLRMRELATESSLGVFATSQAFLYYEQYVAILPQTLQTVGIAVAMVFLVTCIFMPQPLLLMYITLTVAMITVGIFGFLYFISLSLSSITMIHVIMSIGFSVDFSAHICHGYMISRGKDRDEKMTNGFVRSGAPIFHGAISSILGVVMLAAAKSFIFVSFFQVMSLVITFGILHAFFFLPVVLSLIGPTSFISGSKVDCEGNDLHQFSQQNREISYVTFKIPRPSVILSPRKIPHD